MPSPVTREAAPGPKGPSIRSSAGASGRPTSLTPEIHRKVVHAVQVGMCIEAAAALVGVNKTTIYDWMRRGARDRSGPFHEFSRDLTQALAECQYLALSRLHRLMQDGSFQAVSWFLERRFPQEWGRRQAVELTGKVEGTLTLEMVRAAAQLALLDARDTAASNGIK